MTEVEVELPDHTGAPETFGQFWEVGDVFGYDNIGFCRAGEGATFKYLTCAECEYEPIVIQTLGEKKSLLCHGKVVYADPNNTGGHRVMSSGDNAQLDALVAQQKAAAE